MEGTHLVLHRSPPQRRKTKRLTDDPWADLVFPKQTTGILQPQG